MSIPDSLVHKMELFRAKGRIFRFKDDLFSEDSWLAVLLGQGVIPGGYDRLVDRIPLDDLVKNLAHLRQATLKTAMGLPTHQAFIDQTCKATGPAAAA
jgi:tryptophan halogenase